MLDLRKFIAPEFVFGEGALELIGNHARGLGGHKVLLVTDPGVRAAGWAGIAVDSLREAGLSVEIFDDCVPNPRTSQVMEGVRRYHEAGCDLIVAVGGGSPMDLAKGVSISVSSGEHVRAFAGIEQVRAPGPPLICAPTTAGTASEVSQFSIISDQERRVKLAIVSRLIIPDMAFIAPETTLTMDPHLTACTALDALVHAVEAFVSSGGSSVTDLHALGAIDRVTRGLPRVMSDPDDLEARAEVMHGSLMAGLAFSNASLGAVHAMAHALGGLLDLPHGECNALLLEHVVAFNFREVAPRYRRIARVLGASLDGLDDRRACARLVEQIRALRASVGISHSLSDVGVSRGDIPSLAAAAIQDACMATNPRPPQQRDVEVVFEEAL